MSCIYTYKSTLLKCSFNFCTVNIFHVLNFREKNRIQEALLDVAMVVISNIIATRLYQRVCHDTVKCGLPLWENPSAERVINLAANRVNGC